MVFFAGPMFKILKGIIAMTPTLIIYFIRDPCLTHECQYPSKCHAKNGFSYECVDFCFENQCSNSGSCYNATCHCESGSIGLYCEFDTCDQNESKCLNNGTCFNLPENDWEEGVDPFYCRCASDFYYGERCEKVTCSPNLCYNGGSCIDEHQAGCNCLNGYTGDQCEIITLAD